MLNLDQEAMTELLEMETVPVCNTLGALLGRRTKITVTDVSEADLESIGEQLPHFNVVIEGERTAKDLRAPQLYIFERDDMVRLTNFIMGIPVDAPSQLDEIALSTLKEVASQCMSAAMEEIGDFLGRDPGLTLGSVTAYDGPAPILDMIHRYGWNENNFILIRLEMEIDGVFTTDVLVASSDQLQDIFGIPDIGQEWEDQTEAAQLQPQYQAQSQSQTQPQVKAVPVQSVAFPEFQYQPIEYQTDRIGEDRKRLRDITMDVSVRIGSTVCSIKDILALEEGQVLTLDKQAGSPADVMANGKLIGKGDILVTDDRFAARIVEIVGKKE